jgi:hypothetical protein
MGTSVQHISTLPPPSAGAAATPVRRPARPLRDDDWPAGRKVAFDNEDKWDGIYKQEGFIGLEEDALVLEYRERQVLGLKASEVRHLRLELDEIGGVEFKPGWFGGGHLVITGNSLATFGTFPQFRTGSIRLHFSRHNAPLAQRFTERVRRKLEQPRA